MWLLRILILLLPVCLAVPAAAGNDEEDEQAARDYAREDLLREAKRSVEGGGPGVAALEAMRRSLEGDVRFADQVDEEDPRSRVLLEAFRKTIAERRLLIGAATSGVATGAVLEASRLEDWLVGVEPSAVLVRETGTPGGAGQEYVYPPPPPQVPSGAAAKKEDPDPDSKKEAAGKEKDDAAKPEADEVTPWEVPSIATWAREVVQAGEGGSLLRRVFSLERHPEIDSLRAASEVAPAYVHPELRGLHRHALLTGDVFPYNEPLAALRTLQADEHNKAMQADQPQSALVDGGMVREKAGVVDTYHELIERHSKRSQEITAQLDAMVMDLDAWKTQAALLAGEIEERRKALSAKGRAEDGERDLTLRLAQARETCTTLDIMLLYLTANRGQTRLSLLKTLLRAANEEATAAESVRTRYERALQSLRRTRRLDRLSSDNRRLRRWITAAKAEAPQGGSTAAQRLVAYQALLELNDVVRDAVRRRGLMTMSAVDRSTAERLAGEPTDDAVSEADGRRLSTMVREPENANWDAKFVELARRELHDPEFRSAFDADLVAAHYAAVDERIGALLRAYKVSQDESELTERYGDALGEAEAALRQLAGDMFTERARKLPAILSASKEDFSAAMAGITDQREKNQGRLRVLVGYKQELRDLGVRSLLIRVDRNLMDPYLGDALQGTRDALDSAGRWVSFQGDAHAGNFLREAWKQILLAFVLLGLAMLFARGGRSLVDRWIERKVATYPEFERLSASVREERSQGREARQAADLAVSETSVEEVLNQTRAAEDAAGTRAEGDTQAASAEVEETPREERPS